MTEKPLEIALQAWTDAEYRETVEARTAGLPTDFSAYTDIELVAAESFTAPAAAFGVPVTAAPGLLTIVIAEATLAAQLPEGTTEKTFKYVLRARPVGTYRVRLMYGTFKLRKGLPEAAP